MIKKIITYLLLLVLSISGLTLTAQDIPEPMSPPRMINDFAGTMGPEQIAMLEAKVRAYNDSTSTQIVVVTVTSLNGSDVESFTYRLAEKWGVGQKGKNNGLVILVAPNERKMRIEVGYGLESRITDAHSKWIIENLLKPNFKNQAYYDGLNQAIDAIINKAIGEFKRDGSETDKNSKKSFPWLLVLIIIIVIIIIISKNNRSGGSGYTTFNSGGSYFGGGSSWGSGSGGGSSFGGFGGGSFGGGGASGDW